MTGKRTLTGDVVRPESGTLRTARQQKALKENFSAAQMVVNWDFAVEDLGLLDVLSCTAKEVDGSILMIRTLKAC